MTEVRNIEPFATPTGYEIVDCSLKASGLIFLDCVPRPDVRRFPCVGGLALSNEHSPRGSVGGFHRPGLKLTSVTLLFPLSFFFGALPFPFLRGSS